MATAVADEQVLAASALEAAQEQLQTLCQGNAATFVSVERRTLKMKDHLESLVNNIQTLNQQVDSAKTVLGDDNGLEYLSERHRVRRRTLLQHNSLLELLELPNLMDACVRSNMYEEALQIANFANTLSRRHSTSDTVVQDVIQQVRNRQNDLRVHLLNKLRGSVTMPECLEVVTAVRRLNSIDLETKSTANLETAHETLEYHLCVEFLEARDAWLNTKRRSHDEPLLDTIERYRTRVFEIATQFHSIFRAQATSDDATRTLLILWTSKRVSEFLKVLESSLVQDTTAIRDALEASSFFASSMGRLGADFTGQLPRIFEPILIQTIVSYWQEGSEQLKETLKICREAGVASPLRSDTELEGTDNQGEPEPLEGPQKPPKALLEFPPLARFVNSILQGLNELRRCLLPTVFPKLRHSLEDILKDVESDLLSNERAVLVPGFRGDASALRQIASDIQVCFQKIVLPFTKGSLEVALGYSDLARQYHETLYENLKEAEPEPEPVVEEEEEGKGREPDSEEQQDEKEEGQEGDAEESPDQENASTTAEEAEAGTTVAASEEPQDAETNLDEDHDKTDEY